MNYVVQIAVHTTYKEDRVTTTPFVHKYKVNSIKKRIRATLMDDFNDRYRNFNQEDFDKVMIEHGADLDFCIGRVFLLVDDFLNMDYSEIYDRITEEMTHAMIKKHLQLAEMIATTQNFEG